MSLWAALLAPYAAAYARVTGAPLDDGTVRAELFRRGALLPVWALAASGAGTLLLRFLAPLLLLGRPALFEDLSEEEADRLLCRLQRSRLLPLKLLFFMVKAVVLPVRYGRPGFLSAIGYGAPR